MNSTRRTFLQALAALATTAALPFAARVPSVARLVFTESEGLIEAYSPVGELLGAAIAESNSQPGSETFKCTFAPGRLNGLVGSIRLVLPTNSRWVPHVSRTRQKSFQPIHVSAADQLTVTYNLWEKY